MKVICDGIDLCEAVSKVIKAVSTRTTQPILEGIKLKAEGSTLTLTATDLELCIEKKIRADVVTTGEAVVVGKVFNDFIKRLNGEQIELELCANKLIIKYGESNGQLSCYNVEEFPKIAEIDSKTSFSIVKREFKELVSRVAFCVGNDEDRPVFHGIFLEAEDGADGSHINAVAIDGTRMAFTVKPLESKTESMSMIVPAKSLQELSKLVEDSDETLTLYRQNNLLMADLGHTKITTRLIDGEFINYRSIFPTTFKTSVKVHRGQLEHALERASVLSRFGEHNQIMLNIHENVLTMQCESQHGSIKESVAIAMEGKDIDISFNSGYIKDALNAIKDDYITISFIENISPCVIYPIMTQEYKYLILPIRPR